MIGLFVSISSLFGLNSAPAYARPSGSVEVKLDTGVGYLYLTAPFELDAAYFPAPGAKKWEVNEVTVKVSDLRSKTPFLANTLKKESYLDEARYPVIKANKIYGTENGTTELTLHMKGKSENLIGKWNRTSREITVETFASLASFGISTKYMGFKIKDRAVITVRIAR